MKIRDITSADIPMLLAIRPLTRENALTIAQLHALGVTPQSVEAGLECSTAGWLCELSNEEVVGFCMADRRTAELLVIALLPAHEGQGIGGRLMQCAEDWLARSGCAKAWLITDLDPTRRAYGFYRHRGWADWKIERGERFMQLERVPVATGPQNSPMPPSKEA